MGLNRAKNASLFTMFSIQLSLVSKFVPQKNFQDLRKCFETIHDFMLRVISQTMDVYWSGFESLRLFFDC